MINTHNIKYTINNLIENGQILHTEGEECKWGRLICIWNENKSIIENGKECPDQLIHIFAPTINKENGETYVDASKKIIYLKMACHSVYRPIETVIKTIYLACLPISLGVVITKTILKALKNNKNTEKPEKKLNNKQIAKLCLNNSLNSIADIVRTPVYGLAMTAVSIAALIIGPLAPKKLYDLQKMEGKLIQRYHRVQGQVFEDTFACFTPMPLSALVSEFGKRKFKDTIYPGNTKSDQAYANYARAFTKHFRKNRVIFVNPFHKYRENESYISAGFKSLHEALIAKQCMETVHGKPFF